MAGREHWREWLKSATRNEASLKYYERKDIGLIKNLNQRIARDNITSRMKKAYHNLDLAQKIHDMHSQDVKFRYFDETYYDWVITVAYYAMYQAALAALAAVKKEGQNHIATLCALIYYYHHRKKRLAESYLISLHNVHIISEKEIGKMVSKKEERERVSYGASIMTEAAIAETALEDAKEFVATIREVLEDGVGRELFTDI